jgi:H+/gluconate symporter-like permease
LTQNKYWDHITRLSDVSNIVQRLRIIDDSALHTQHHVAYPHPGFLRNALDGHHFGTTIYIKLIATIGGQIANGNAQSRLLTRTTRPSA